MGRSYNTQKTYISWIERFRQFSRCISPQDIRLSHLKGFLTSLSLRHNVAPATQRQAFNACLFFFRYILCRELGDLKHNEIHWAPPVPLNCKLTDPLRPIHERLYPFSPEIAMPPKQALTTCEFTSDHFTLCIRYQSNYFSSGRGFDISCSVS